jgi:Domain of unknown function (DUF4157)
MPGPTATKSSKDKSTETTEGRAQEQVSQPAMPRLQADLLALQRTAGNQAVSQLLQPSAIGSPSSDDVKDPDETTQNSSFKPLPSTRAFSADPKSPPAEVLSVLESSGQPLAPATRVWMEAHFRHDFGDVRILTDTRAAQTTRGANAPAYTVGRAIVFRSQQYAPHTRAGQYLLAHELAHVVQQKRAGNDLKVARKWR